MIASVAVVLLSRSSWGMEKVRGFVTAWLSDNIQGESSIGGIGGDGLLNGVMVREINIAGADGQPFLRADSVSARYRILDLLFGRIVMSPVHVWGADLHVTRLPGQLEWNYQRIFTRVSDTAAVRPGDHRLVRFTNVRMANSTVTVTMPFEGDPRGGRGSRYVLRDTAGGTAQVMRFENLNGAVSEVIWSRPGDETREFRIDDLAATVQVLQDAFPLSDVRGSVTLQDSTIGIDIRQFRLADSRGSTNGRVITGADGMRYDLRVDGSDVRLADLRWIDARVPVDGQSKFVLRVESQADGGLLLNFQDFDVTAPASHVTGTFGLLAAEPMALRDVDLRLSPLDLGWISLALADTVPLPGRLTGRVRANGPLTALRTTGDLQLSNWGGPSTPTLRWSGGVRLDARLAARRLSADFTDFDLALIERFRPGLGLAGRLDGRADLDGPVADSLHVRTVVRYTDETGVSEFDGGGALALGRDGPRFDLEFEARPLQLTSLARYAEQLSRLHGTATGSMAISGRPDSLRVAGSVRTEGGPLVFDARLDQLPSGRGIVAQGRSSGFEPARLGLVDVDAKVSGAFDLRLTGREVRELEGPIRLDLDSARVRAFPIERSFAALSLHGGLATVDSATITSRGLRAIAFGRFGLTPEIVDSLDVVITSPSFEPLESVIFGEVIDPLTPRVTGSGRADLTISGSIASFGMAGSAVLDHPAFDGRTATSVRLSGSAENLLSDSLRFAFEAEADSVRAFNNFADSLAVSMSSRGGNGRIAFDSWRSDSSAIHAVASFGRVDDGQDWQVEQLRFLAGAGSWRMGRVTGVRIAGRTATIDSLRLIPSLGGEIIADGRLAWADSVATPASALSLDFDLGLHDVPFGLLPFPMRPQGDIRGTIDGQVRLTGSPARPLVDGHVHIGNVEYEGADLERVDASIHYADQIMVDTVLAWLDNRVVLNGAGRIPIDLRFAPVEQRILDQPVEFTVRMDSFPAAFTLGFNSTFTNTQGVIDGSITAAGSARDPKLSGSLLLRNGATTWSVSGVRYVRAEGTFLMDSNLSATIDLTAFTAQPGSNSPSGSARLMGTLDLSHPTNPGFNLDLRAERILGALRRDVQLTASGTIHLDSSYSRPFISGNLRVDGGTLNIDELYRQFLIVQLEDPFYYDLIDTTAVSAKRVLPEIQSPFVRNMRIANLNVNVGEGSWLRSREMNVEVAGELNVNMDRQADDLQMTGALRVVRGTYRLEYPPLSRLFEVRQGSVDFPGTPGIDPNLNITAAYTARTGAEPLEIFADVTGTLQSPRVHLRSDQQPPISESDLAAYLFIGTPTYLLNNLGSTQGATGLVSSFGEQLLANTLSSGLQTIGQSFGLVDYVGLTTAQGEQTTGQAGALGGLLSNTKIEIGRYITPSLFVKYTQRLDARADAPGVRLEWRFHPTYTAELFSEDRFARAPSFGLGSIAAQRIFGFFISREWGYK